MDNEAVIAFLADALRALVEGNMVLENFKLEGDSTKIIISVGIARVDHKKVSGLAANLHMAPPAGGGGDLGHPPGGGFKLFNGSHSTASGTSSGFFSGGSQQPPGGGAKHSDVKHTTSELGAGLPLHPNLIHHRDAKIHTPGGASKKTETSHSTVNKVLLSSAHDRPVQAPVENFKFSDNNFVSPGPKKTKPTTDKPVSSTVTPAYKIIEKKTASSVSQSQIPAPSLPSPSSQGGDTVMPNHQAHISSKTESNSSTSHDSIDGSVKTGENVEKQSTNTLSNVANKLEEVSQSPSPSPKPPSPIVRKSATTKAPWENGHESVSQSNNTAFVPSKPVFEPQKARKANHSPIKETQAPSLPNKAMTTKADVDAESNYIHPFPPPPPPKNQPIPYIEENSEGDTDAEGSTSRVKKTSVESVIYSEISSIPIKEESPEPVYQKIKPKRKTSEHSKPKFSFFGRLNRRGSISQGDLKVLPEKPKVKTDLQEKRARMRRIQSESHLNPPKLDEKKAIMMQEKLRKAMDDSKWSDSITENDSSDSDDLDKDALISDVFMRSKSVKSRQSNVFLM